MILCILHAQQTSSVISSDSAELVTKKKKKPSTALLCNSIIETLKESMHSSLCIIQDIAGIVADNILTFEEYLESEGVLATRKKEILEEYLANEEALKIAIQDFENSVKSYKETNKKLRIKLEGR